MSPGATAGGCCRRSLSGSVSMSCRTSCVPVGEAGTKFISFPSHQHLAWRSVVPCGKAATAAGPARLREGRDVTDSREDTVTYAEEADERVGRSPARVILGVILVIIGILLIIASILYFTQPAHSLPSILGTLKHPPNSIS